MAIHHVPSVTCFAQAKMKWASTEPWRSDPVKQDRPLSDRRDKHIIIRSTNAPDSPVSCRLYATDCVTFHSDGTIDIVGYPSKSTVEFIRNVLGMHVNPLHQCDAYEIVDSVVVAGPDIKIRPTGPDTPAEVLESGTFTFHKLNRRKVNAFFKELRWSEFKTWALTAYDILGGDLEALYDAATEAFPEIHAIGGFDFHYPPAICRAGGQQLVAALRKSIQQANIRRLRDTEEVAYCTDHKEYMRRVQASRRAS